MKEWYKHSFGEDYLVVYQHRNRLDASKQVEKLVDWLELDQSDLILDLCCGNGRHTIALTERGYHVVGVDLSEALLLKAVQNSKGMGIPFIKGDMRCLPFVDNTFDVVVNLFTSFGYFAEDKENQQVFKEIARVLNHNGRFLIDFLNRSAVEKNLVPRSEREQGGIKIREERYIEGDFVCKKIFVCDEDGEREYQERVKMYDLNQMEQMITHAGLSIKQVFGNFEGETYHQNSERMIIMGCVQK